MTAPSRRGGTHVDGRGRSGARDGKFGWPQSGPVPRLELPVAELCEATEAAQERQPLGGGPVYACGRSEPSRCVA